MSAIESRPIIRQGPPELQESIRRILGVQSLEGRLVSEHRMQRRYVARSIWRANGTQRSIVAKRLTAARAAIEHLVLERWLPANDLRHVGPALLGVAREADGVHVWHVYEDLGDGMLDQEASGDGARADRGFLSPLRRCPARGQIETVLRTIAAVHTKFEAHPRLPEYARASSALGAGYLETSVDAAIEALESIDAQGCALSEAQIHTRNVLLAKLGEVREEVAWRTQLLTESGGRDTLLHGDLGARNAFVFPAPQGEIGRLIDWEHAGVGPISYDLSTLLMQLPFADRFWILELYQSLRANTEKWPTLEEWDLLFETAELSRLATCVTWAVDAVSSGDTGWGFAELGKIASWFRSLGPVMRARDRGPRAGTVEA